MSQSFFLSNMSPQLPAFNRGIWRSLESAVRAWAESKGSIYVVTGPVFSPYGDEIGSNGVDIPTQGNALINVNGIGRKILAGIRGLVTVN
jgi:DNA/RNA endonuclease G (NUC1)